jgi:hypothetical protein
MPETTRYRQRLAAGLCVGCGARKPKAGRARCPACLKAVREAQAERTRLLLKSGTCRTCGQRPAAEGHRDCRDCLDRYAGYTRERKASGV